MAAAHANDVAATICISVKLEQLEPMREAVAGCKNVFTTVGVHPLYTNCEEPTAERIIELADHPGVVAIGETGLDYFKPTGEDTKDSEIDIASLEWQRERFRQHIRAANQLDMPVVVHTRKARADTLAILREEQAEQGVIHCFSENWSFAKTALDLGFYISLSGILTYNSAKSLQSIAKKLPQDRILVETDAPWLAPEPHRGKENQPAFVRHTAEFLAELRGERFEDVAAYTTENCVKCFSLEL